MMKKIAAMLIVAVMLVMTSLSANATMEFTTVDAPYGIMYKVYNDTVAERISISCCFTDSYAAVTSMSNEESAARYGMTNISTYVQIDYRIDGGNWQYSELWETTPSAPHYGGQVPNGETVRTFDLLYLVNDRSVKDAGALVMKNEQGQTVFDLDNHTLEFRMRVSMKYTDVIDQVKVSQWSEVIKVERNPDFGKAPGELETPKASNPRIEYQEDERPYIVFDVMTPESVKKAEAWFSTQQPTYVSLIAEIDKGNGSWESVSLSGNSHYANETKSIYLEDIDLEDTSKMRVRLHYLVYAEEKTIYSEYSDILEFDVPRWVEGKGIMHAKCKVCGICRPIFGKCMFVIGGIVLLVVIIAAVPVKMKLDKISAQKAALEEERQKKLEAERKAYDKAKQEKKKKNKK